VCPNRSAASVAPDDGATPSFLSNARKLADTWEDIFSFETKDLEMHPARSQIALSHYLQPLALGHRGELETPIQRRGVNTC
jgi:hypothetical protein